MLIKNVNDLQIYKLALGLSSKITKIAEATPFHWSIPEIDQIKRSSSSVHANIAEGFSQRFYPKKFILYLNYSLGSSDETNNHIEKLYLDSKIDEATAQDFMRSYKDLSIRIVNFINYLRKRHGL